MSSSQDDSNKNKNADILKRRATAEIRRPLQGEVGKIELDISGFITNWSNEAEKLYGYSVDEIIGKHFASLFCEAELEKGRVAYELIKADSKGRYCAFGWQLKKNGQQFWTYSESQRTDNGFILEVMKVQAPE